MNFDNSNVIIIVQARMGSNRLPGKVMRKINGVPMIGIQLNRIKKSGYKTIVAAPIGIENDKLCEYVKSLDIDVFRGSEENVLDRHYKTAQHYNADIIIRIPGDKPLIDGAYINQVMNGITGYHERLYISPGMSKTFPVGMSFEAFSFSLLEEAYLRAGSDSEKEHVTPYIRQNFPGDIEIRTVRNVEDYSKMRLTVDTDEDFELIKLLVENYDCNNKSMFEIIDLLNKKPELLNINSGIRQKKWNES